MNLSTLLNLLPAVGPIIAAAPEFKRMFDEAVALLSEDDQDVAKQAYDLAVDRASEAHTELQQLIDSKLG